MFGSPDEIAGRITSRAMKLAKMRRFDPPHTNEMSVQ